jgi:hypothetical protein
MRLAKQVSPLNTALTFGQALSAARNDPLTAEYGKAIVFDYSYRYFYGDGYGKDFRILNLQDETDEDKTDLLLLGNLLSFYEQQRLFDEQAEVLRPYNWKSRSGCLSAARSTLSIARKNRSAVTC